MLILYYYFDSSNIYHCTLNNSCVDSHKYLINNTKQCIEKCSRDIIYKYEYNNICYKSCPNGTYILNKNDNLLCVNKEISNMNNINYIKGCFDENILNDLNSNCDINIIDNYNKDHFIEIIQNEITNHSFDSLISNIIEGKKNDLIINDNYNNILYQITSSDNQNNNKYDNISNIILGKCEELLKKKYDIKEEEALFIFKIDYYQPGSLIPIIGYELFHPRTKERLNLSYCKEEIINFNIPVSIDENNVFKYDPNNEYYKDECYPYTTENDTDIIINDRQKEFNDNNLSLCENNCTYNGYDNNTKKAKCECKVKSKLLLMSELINQTNLLTYNFIKKIKIQI